MRRKVAVSRGVSLRKPLACRNWIAFLMLFSRPSRRPSFSSSRLSCCAACRAANDEREVDPLRLAEATGGESAAAAAAAAASADISTAAASVDMSSIVSSVPSGCFDLLYGAFAARSFIIRMRSRPSSSPLSCSQPPAPSCDMRLIRVDARMACAWPEMSIIPRIIWDMKPSACTCRWLVHESTSARAWRPMKRGASPSAIVHTVEQRCSYTENSWSTVRSRSKLRKISGIWNESSHVESSVMTSICMGAGTCTPEDALSNLSNTSSTRTASSTFR
mmetsp:Transcript_14962/g.34559  ORF Transcript_14962/g.34559 Transcript_14962/m.34559 type:complete len:276 (-) Transcript_14962:213-1040(-)